VFHQTVSNDKNCDNRLRCRNVQSVKFALERLGSEAILTNDIDEIINAWKVIFPGVGEAQSAMNALKSFGLDKVIPELKTTRSWNLFGNAVNV
jgi:imidazoleglycerol phosphate synthase glutamine amidotransferase subunit HisH